MRASKHLKNYLKSFYGFGKWKSDFYFVGLEFGGVKSENLNLRIDEWSKMGRKSLVNFDTYHNNIGQQNTYQRTYDTLCSSFLRKKFDHDVKACFIDISPLPLKMQSGRIRHTEFLEIIHKRSKFIANQIMRNKPKFVILYGLDKDYFSQLECLLNFFDAKKVPVGKTYFKWKQVDQHTIIIQVTHHSHRHQYSTEFTQKDIYKTIRRKLLYRKLL